MSEKPLIDVAQEKILSLADETKFAPNGIVSRTLLRTATLRVVRFGFAEGQELSEHTSTQHAIIQILSGKCALSLGGKPYTAKAGDWIYMPPNLPHALMATTQQAQDDHQHEAEVRQGSERRHELHELPRMKWKKNPASSPRRAASFKRRLEGSAGVPPAVFGDSPKTFQTINISLPQRSAKAAKIFQPLIDADAR